MSPKITIAIIAAVTLGATALSSSDGAAQSPSPPKIRPKVMISNSLKIKDQVRREEHAWKYRRKPFYPKSPCVSC